MARDVKDLLSMVEGGPVAPPDVAAIRRRGRRLTLLRAGALAGAGVLLAAAAIGLAGLFDPARMPLVGEPLESPTVEPIDPAVVDVPEAGPPIWVTELDVPAFGGFGSGSQLASNSQQLFVASGHADDAAVVALDLATGEVAWRTGLNGSAYIQVATDALVIANSQHHHVVALDVATGEQVWEHELPVGYGAVSAVVADATLYLVAGAGGEGDTSPPRIHALGLDDGQVRWASTLTAGTDPQWSPPAIVDGLLLVAATLANPGVEPGNQVHALQVSDGGHAWTVDLGGRQGFSIRATALTDGLLHVHVRGVGVATLEVATGAIAHTIEDAILMGAGPNGPLYIAGTGEPTVVRAVNPDTGQPLAHRPAWILQDDWFSIQIHGPDFLLPSTTTLFAVDTNSGTLRWRHTHDTPVYEILVLDGLLIAANQNAQIVATLLPDN